MKKLFLLLTASLLCYGLFAQNRVEAEKLVKEGIAYHDKGDYNGALAKYEKALQLDKDNLLALAEKAYTYLQTERYQEAKNICEKAISTHYGDPNLSTVYVTYGNATDGLKNTDRSLTIYDEGLKQFPDYYQLHFNKGVTYSSIKKYDEALKCFQTAAQKNPKHASSHNAIARIQKMQNKRIPALLAYLRFFVIEPKGPRAAENLETVRQLFAGDMKQTGKNTYTLSINSLNMFDTLQEGKSDENNFRSTDVMLTLSEGLNLDKKMKNKPEVERFAAKLEILCKSLLENKKENTGFFWTYYAPYFMDMQLKNHTLTLAYIAYASSDDKDVSKWIKSHQKEIDEFFEWSKGYDWSK